MVLEQRGLLESRFSPSTRYQGSKRKLLGWIHEKVNCLEFDSALDLFGGSGMVGFLFKKMGKHVTYNDYLKFNYYIGKALIENNEVTLTDRDISFLIEFRKYDNRTFIQDNFKDIYYTDEENKWLDSIIGNIGELENMFVGPTLEYKKALAYYALFQSCLVKRPFNLFHRKNLYLRVAQVKRRFGNKTTWEKPFDILYKQFAEEINRYVFSNGRDNKAINRDAFAIDKNVYDLIYIDPPYFRMYGSTPSPDYSRMYHFLEGIANYGTWDSLIDYKSLNLHFKEDGYSWPEKNKVADKIEQLFSKLSKSIVVLSYKSPGIPNEEELIALMGKYKQNVQVHRLPYRYALSKSKDNQSQNYELLIIGS